MEGGRRGRAVPAAKRRGSPRQGGEGMRPGALRGDTGRSSARKGVPVPAAKGTAGICLPSQGTGTRRCGAAREARKRGAPGASRRPLPRDGGGRVRAAEAPAASTASYLETRREVGSSALPGPAPPLSQRRGPLRDDDSPASGGGG